MDRNNRPNGQKYINRRSLSARRAWIEIINEVWANFEGFVALRKESVDRNITRGQLPAPEPPSLSARRAWIEMDWASVISAMTSRRSPQGERG